MISLKLAYRNLTGAGLRTWLNVTVLSFAYVVIIFHQGLIDGWHRQGLRDLTEWEVAGGQLWHPSYDRYDPMTFQDAHGVINGRIPGYVKSKLAVPVLVVQGTAYPQGRLQSIILKGIDRSQSLVKLPSSALAGDSGKINAVIGTRMAKSLKAEKGDYILIRWRDKNGAFDAAEIYIAEIFKCDVPSVDIGQIWVPLDKLQEMTGLHNEATMFIVSDQYKASDTDGWKFKEKAYLTKELDELIQAKRGGGMILQGILLIIALLAIFDTQVLSIFRRQREIGTYIAFGMTRYQVVGIFTVEGAAHSIFAAVLGALYGIPLFIYLYYHGITFGLGDMGLTLAETLYPYYSLQLIVITVAVVVIAATIVSFLPARKIAKMKPTDALKGKLQ